VPFSNSEASSGMRGTANGFSTVTAALGGQCDYDAVPNPKPMRGGEIHRGRQSGARRIGGEKTRRPRDDPGASLAGRSFRFAYENVI
jgi:hypothetical protein